MPVMDGVGVDKAEMGVGKMYGVEEDVTGRTEVGQDEHLMNDEGKDEAGRNEALLYDAEMVVVEDKAEMDEMTRDMAEEEEDMVGMGSVQEDTDEKDGVVVGMAVKHGGEHMVGMADGSEKDGVEEEGVVVTDEAEDDGAHGRNDLVFPGCQLMELGEVGQGGNDVVVLDTQELDGLTVWKKTEEDEMRELEVCVAAGV